MPLPPKQNYTPMNKVRLLLGIIFAVLLGYYFFTDDRVALLVALMLMVIATILFIRNVLSGKPFWKNLKKWLGEVWDFISGIG